MSIFDPSTSPMEKVNSTSLLIVAMSCFGLKVYAASVNGVIKNCVELNKCDVIGNWD